MPEIDPVIFEYRAKVDQYVADVRRTTRTVDQQLGLQEKRVRSLEGQFRASGAGIARGLAVVGTAAASYISLDLGREFLRIADSAKQLEATLKLATRESGNFAQAQEDVRRIAIETRSDLKATADLYATFQRNSRELGISQEEAARATETVTKAFRVSGASAAEAAGGLRQFLQGIQSGTLRGEELNSVLENAPRLARLLADSLGVTIGQLRELGQEGELSADRLLAALTERRFTDAIDAEFRELPKTFDEAMTNVETAATIVFGAFDRGGQFSTALANFATDGSGNFADLEAAAESFGRTVSTELAGIIGVISSVSDAIGGLISRLNSFSGGNLANILANAGPIGQAISLIRSTDAYQNAAGARAAELAGGNNPSLFALGKDAFQQLNTTRSAGPTAIRPTTRPATTRTGPSNAETAVRRAEQERLRAIRDEAARAEDLARIEDDLIAARAALATSAQDIAAFEVQMIDRMRDADIARLQTELELGELSQAELNERRALIEQRASAERELVAARQAQVDAELRDLQERNSTRSIIDTLAAESDIARTLDERRAIEERILDLAYQQEEAEIRRAAANGEIADLDEELARMRRRQKADGEALRQRSLSPGGRYLEDLKGVSENINESLEGIQIDGLEALNDGLTDAILNAENLGDVFSNVADQIIRDLVRIAIQQSIIQPLASSLFGGGKGSGGFFGSLLGGIFGGARASGGPVAGGKVYLVGEKGPELFAPGLSGNIIPNQNLSAAGGAAGTVRVVIEEAPGFAARVRTEATGVAVEVTRAAAPRIIEGAVGETFRRSQRPKL